MAKICECRKYAIFRLYLTINPEKPASESFYGAVNIVSYIGERTECPGHAWCPPSMPKMTKKIDKVCREWPFYQFLAYFPYAIYPKRLFIHSKLYL